MLSVPVRSKHALINATLVVFALFALALFGATSAHAQADNFLNGDGHDGTVTFAAGTHVPNAVAPVSGAVPSGATSITIGATVAGSGSNTVGFATNRLVMIYQSNGVASPPTSGSQTAYPLSNSTAGHWEFGRLTSATATTLTFTNPLIKSYASGATQVIAVPEYNGVTIATGATINPPTWNGTTGGVVAVLAQGTMNVAGTGTITARGLGFRGGLTYVNNLSEAHNCSLTAYDSPGTDGFGMKGEGFYSTAYATATPGTNAQHGRGNQINAGGGGNCFNGGGGGGGNVGQGGQGGNTLNQNPGSNIAGGGLGGAALTYNAYQQLPMGGGGGHGDRDDGNSGAGAKGGGVVYVRGGTLTGTGTFSANGATGTGGNNVGTPYDGAGGGGAAGSVVLRFVNGATCTAATAIGGTGGANGTSGSFNWTPGGGGGGGAVYVQGSTVTCTRTVTGGPRGTGGSNAGATAGGNGTAAANATGLTAPVVTLAAPVNGTTYSTTTPAINGTATTGSTVYVYVDGVFVSTAAAPAGNWSYSTAALSQGSHTVMVFSDVNGSQSTQVSSTFTVDTIAPAAPVITTPATSPFYSSTATPTVAGTAEANSTVKVYDGASLVGTTTANGSGNWTLSTSALSVGSHTITATATDAANNVSAASTSKTIVVDTSAPTVALSTPANGALYATTTPALSFTVTEANLGTTTCIIDGGAPVACTSGTNMSALGQGSHTLQVRHTDLAGNVGNSSLNTFTIDTVAPAAPVITTPASSPFYTNDTTPTVAGTAEANSTVRVYDGATLVGTATANGSGNWTVDTSALSVGSHTITATATDAANNTGAASTSKTIIIDTTAPAAPVVTSPVTPYTTNDTTPTFGGTAEANNNVYIYVDGVLNSVTSSNGSGNWTIDLATVAAGTHSVYVTSMDQAGNTSPQSAPPRSLTIDTTAPAVNITAPANAATVAPNGNVVFTATDAVGPVTTTCAIDAAAPVSCTSPFVFSGLSTGAHSATVVATDAAGNTATAVRNFNVDATPPNTTITGNPLAVTTLTTATFTFTSTESPSTFECQLDGNPIASCTSGIAYSGLAEGTHTFQVRATDQYGNIDLSPASYTWTVDTTAPVAPSITTPASDIVTSDTTPAIGGLSEIGSTVRVYEGATLIGTAVANGSGVWALSPDPTLSVGVHILFATATDAATNVSANSGNRTITIDTTAPTVALTVPIVGTTPANGSSINTTTPSITFTVSDTNPAASSSCIVDGGAPVTCTSGFTTAALGQGSHTIRVTHTDLAGNLGTSATNTFTVDTSAPAAPVITGGPSAPVASTSASFTFTGEVGATYECYIDSPVTWVACTSPAAYSSLAQGAHTFHVRQTDAAGNVSPESTRSWSVDTVGPPAPSVSGPSGTVGSSSASITFSDTEAPVTFMCKLDAAAYAACTSPVSLSGLANGAHSYSVYAVDALGNAGSPTTINWTVDTSLFTVSITAGPTGTVATANNSLSFVATITSGTTYQCKLDAGAFALCTSPYSTGALADGSHTFSVYAVNGAQSSPTVARTYTIDTTGPAISISAPLNAATVAPSGNATFTATDATGPVTTTCKIDSGTANNCTSPFAYAGLTDGAHSVTIVATDGAGNVSTLVRNFTVDATPPNTTITANPNAVTNSTNASFSFISTESPSTFECQLDGNPIASCTSPNSYAGLSEGSHTFGVRATDQYGNVDLSPATYTWSVDTTAPIAPSINTPSTNIVTSDTTPAVAGLAEPNSTVRVYEGATLIGTATANGSGVWALSPDPTLSVGAHVLVARATDAAGNVSPNSVSRTITVDTTAPTVALTAPANGVTITTNTPTITFSVTDANPSATSSCSIDGAPGLSCTSGTATPPLSEGSHTVLVTHTDLAGNVGSSATNTFTVDTQGPPAPTVNGPSGTVALTTASITFSDTEAPVTFKCSLDGAAATTCTSPVNLTGLGDGPHSYAIYAVDTHGNAGAATTINWTVDHTLFTTSITAGPLGTVVTASNSLSFVASITSGTTYECKIDAGSYAVCSSPFSTGALADGSHTFSVRAKNGPDTTPAATRTWTVDTTGPTLSITAPADGATVGPNGNVTFTATDATGPVSYTCQIDGGSAVSCGSPFGFSGLSDGAHTVTVVATDNVGNTSNATRNFIVDAIEPDTSITANPAVHTSSTTATFSFTSTEPSSTFECSVDGAPAVTCTSPTTYIGVAEGTHNIQVRAIDAHGNYDQTPASFVWTVDLTAPVAPSINTPSADLHTNDTTPPIGGLAEPNSTVNVYDGATLIGTVTADGAGAWLLSPDPTLTEGPHDITATATDEAGNTSPPSAIREITIDTIFPVVTITSPANGSVINTNSPDIEFTATDTNLNLVQCSLDGSVAVACSSPWPTSGLSEGLHSVSVLASDETGAQQTVETTTFTVDTIAPNAPVIATPATDGSTSNVRPTIGGSAEPDSAITVYDNGAQIGTATTDGSGNWTFTPTSDLADGAHPFTVTATDEAGNVSVDSNTRTLTVDTISPNAPVITSPASDGVTNDATPTLGGTAEASSTVKIYEDSTLLGSTTADGSGNWTFTPSSNLSQGAHALHATATDDAGNVSGDSNVRTLTVDTVAPTSQITGHPNAVDNDSTPTFQFNSTDGTATFECRIDSGVFAACSSPFTASPALTDGPHTFEVRANDPAGNTESPARSFSWTVDTTPPAKPVVTVPTAGITTTDNTPTISGTAEPNSSVQVFVDGNPIGTVTTNGAGNWTISSSQLADGPHNATAQATDAAGNTGATSDAVAFTVDTTPPGGTVTQQPGSGGGGSNPTFDISTPDPAATIACSLDGAPSAPCSSPFTPTGTLAPGTHTLVVTFTDPAGNVTTRTITFVIAGVSVTPPPTDSDPLPSACFAKGIAISNLAVVGGKVRVSGFARLSYVGKTVTLTYKPTGAKVAATGVVGVDGSFTATAKAPANNLRLSNKTLYRATVGGESTPWTKLARRVASSTAVYKNGKLVVSGLLSKPLMPKAPVTIAARTGCNGPWVTITKGAVKSNGAFSTSTSYTVSTGVVFVRVAAVVSKGGTKPKALRTYSFVMPVVLR